MWFKSKLQSPDPEVRRQHLEHLEPQDELLEEIARTDPHPDVRSAALTRLVDLNTLQELAGSDTDERNRKQATARLQTLLSGVVDPSPTLEARQEFFSGSDDERLARFLVRSGHEPELRKLALAKVLKRRDEPAVQDLLCEIATNDSVREIREAAADPVHDARRLQTLLEMARGRDKNIHRLARERLNLIEQQREAKETLEHCCLEIEQLRDHHFSADAKVEESRLAKIVSKWTDAASVIEHVDKHFAARFKTAREAIQEILSAIAEDRHKRTEILAALRVHLTNATGEPVAELIKRWHDLDEPTPQQAREFTKLVAEVTEHDSQRDRDNHRVVAKQGLLKRLEQAIAAESVRESVLTRIEKRWDAAPDPEDQTRKNELRDQFLSLREKLRSRLEAQEREQEERAAKVAALLEQYETALENGKLKAAGSAHDKIVNALATLSAPLERKQPLIKKLRAGEPRMSELRRWRHWGTEKKREELCDAVEKLAESGLKISAVAKAVRDSREAWKALDKSDGPSGRKLWHRFDTACEKAYAPCQAHFDQQKAQRQGNLAKRVAICVELETLAANTDWDAPPWRELTDAMRDTERTWRSAGSVDRRERNSIQARFDQARAVIDEHLKTMRTAEVERREALISLVEELADTEDTGRATDAAKRAQREWKPIVQSGRRKEQDLWKRFRAACDAVFDRRKEQFAVADNERAQHLGEKLAVCGQIEEIAAELKTQLEAGTGDAETVREIRGKARQLSSGWQRIGPIPREKQKEVEDQFRRGCKEIEQLCGRLERQLQHQAGKALRDAGSDCDQLELAVASGNSIDPAAVEAIEARLARLPTGNVLAERLKQLQSVAAGDAQALKQISDSLPANLETRLRICLEMEIAANIDSPAEFSEERMQFRVQQLKDSMSGNRKQHSPDDFERMWYETGPTPENRKAELDERFSRALRALSGS